MRPLHGHQVQAALTVLRGVCGVVQSVSYWIGPAVWRQAGRPPWGEGCRPRGRSGRKARPGRRDLPGTPLPRCFQTPGAKTHAGISHPLAAIRTLRWWETMAQLWRHSDAPRHAHLAIYISHVHCGTALCESLCRRCRGRHTNVQVQTVNTKASFFPFSLPHIHKQRFIRQHFTYMIYSSIVKVLFFILGSSKKRSLVFSLTREDFLFSQDEIQNNITTCIMSWISERSSGEQHDFKLCRYICQCFPHLHGPEKLFITCSVLWWTIITGSELFV